MPKTSPEVNGTSHLRQPRLEMLWTAFRDQSGALYFVIHGGEPLKLGTDQGRPVIPPMVIAETAADFELVAESLCYETVRHVNGSSRAAQLAYRVQREIARIPVSGPDVRRRIRESSKAA